MATLGSFPGQAVELRFGHALKVDRLAVGHRLRLALSNGYRPLVWPSPKLTAQMFSRGIRDLPVDQRSDAAWQPPEAAMARALNPAVPIRRVAG